MDSTVDSQAAVVVVTLNGATVSVAVDAAKGSVVVNLSSEDGEQVTLDSERVERLRESLERLHGENIELRAHARTTDNVHKGERYKLHAQRLDLSERLRDAAARAYAAERRVRELEARIESMEMDAKVEGYRNG